MASIGFNPLMFRPGIMDVKYGYLQGAGGGQYGPSGPSFYNQGYDSMFSPMGGMGFSSPMMMMNMMQQMMDVIRDVRDKLGAMEQSRAETIRGIARNI